MHYKQVANRWKEKWQTGGREKCHSTAKPSEVVKVWSIRPPSFCVDCVDSVPNLPRPMKIFSQKAPGSFIHKLYGLRSPNSQPSELGNLTRYHHTLYLEAGNRRESSWNFYSSVFRWTRSPPSANKQTFFEHLRLDVACENCHRMDHLR